MRYPTASTLCLLALASTLALAGARAQTPATTGPGTPDNITDQIMEKRHRLDQYLKLMRDLNPATRLTAIQQALKDPDPVVRGGAMSAYLKRFNALTPEVMPEKASMIASQDVPRLALFDLAWSDDGASALGRHASSCTGVPLVRLQIAGGRLAVNYDAVCLRPVLLGVDTGGDDTKARKEVPIPCQLVLTPNADDTSLDGPLQCVGMVTPLPVQLPFGP